jgi:mono/diheme cytochrome c family protein
LSARLKRRLAVLKSSTFLAALLLVAAVVYSQEAKPKDAKPTPNVTLAPVPQDAARQANPVKLTPESLARGKKRYALDCAMCHGDTGDGKGDLAKDMGFKLKDFSDPAGLKDRTDGDLFYIIKAGHGDMPPEGDRVKPDDIWDLVNYLRSLAKKPAADSAKPQ